MVFPLLRRERRVGELTLEMVDSLGSTVSCWVDWCSGSELALCLTNFPYSSSKLSLIFRQLGSVFLDFFLLHFFHSLALAPTAAAFRLGAVGSG